MDFAKDYYSILGCAPDADQTVIQAAYRALSKKHHPDVNKGSQESKERFQEIQEAYEILSDPTKRAYYDSMRSGVSGHEYAPGDSFPDDANLMSDELRKRWEVIEEYFSDVNDLAMRLGEISPNLKLIFQLILLENRKFNLAKSLADEIEDVYLSRYFGQNDEIKSLAQKLLRHKNMSRHADALRELNKTMAVLGDEAPHDEIIRKLQDKYDLYWVYFESGDKPYRSDELLNTDDWQGGLPATREAWTAIQNCSQKFGWRYDFDIFGIYHFVNSYSAERKVFDTPESARTFMKIPLDALIDQRRREFLKKYRR